MEGTWVIKVCPECGSDDVRRPGTAYWNVQDQEWVLESISTAPPKCRACGYAGVLKDEEN